MDTEKEIIRCVDSIIESKDNIIKQLEAKIYLLEVELIRKDEKIDLTKLALIDALKESKK